MLVYTIKNTVNGKRYVGLTMRDPETRFQEHLTDAFRQNRSSKTYLSNAIRKHGPENFILAGWIQLGAASDGKSPKQVAAILGKIEGIMINQAGTMDRARGYNLTSGGETNVSSPELRQRASERGKALWKNPKYRKKMARAVSEGQRKRTPESYAGATERLRALSADPEHRKRQSERAKTLWCDPEFREKTTAAIRERALTPEDRARMAETMRRNRMTVISPEVRARMTETLKRTCADPEWRATQREKALKLWADPDFRAKSVEANRAAINRRINGSNRA